MKTSDLDSRIQSILAYCFYFTLLTCRQASSVTRLGIPYVIPRVGSGGMGAKGTPNAVQNIVQDSASRSAREPRGGESGVLYSGRG